MRLNRRVTSCVVILFFIFSTFTNTFAMSKPPNSSSAAYLQSKAQSEPNVCFSSEDTKKLVVELEKCKIVEKNIVVYYNSNVELSKQIDLLKQEIDLLNQKYQVASDLEKKNEEIYAQKIKVYETDLKNAEKPRWGSLLGSFGLGSIVTGIVILILVH